MYENKTIALIVPALNEAEGVKKVISSCPGYVDRIVVADNGSTDHTAKVALSLGAEVVEAVKRGYGTVLIL